MGGYGRATSHQTGVVMVVVVVAVVLVVGRFTPPADAGTLGLRFQGQRGSQETGTPPFSSGFLVKITNASGSIHKQQEG